MSAVTGSDTLDFIWLELTGRCNLTCAHCYASSGPHGDHGAMTTTDWRRVTLEAAALGVRDVQLIGGEPTLHPAFPELLTLALHRGMSVEVYTNLVRVTPELWHMFGLSGVSLAVSYYSIHAAEHDAITKRRSHDRTLTNMREAIERGIALRVAIVDMGGSQDIQATVGELNGLGVDRIRVDRMRQVGRGVRDRRPDVDQLCGRCADGSLAVLPSGEVVPCVFARWMTLGNVRQMRLGAIHEVAQVARAKLRARFQVLAACPPRGVGPMCPPYFVKPDCPPMGRPDDPKPQPEPKPK